MAGFNPNEFANNITSFVNGDTITAIIACLGASVSAKRTAASHVIFNLVGAIIFTLLLSPGYLHGRIQSQ
jgi:Na+/phosphate symporter